MGSLMIIKEQLENGLLRMYSSPEYAWCNAEYNIYYCHKVKLIPIDNTT